MTNKVSDNLDDLSIPELEALLQKPLTEDDSESDVALSYVFLMRINSIRDTNLYQNSDISFAQLLWLYIVF